MDLKAKIGLVVRSARERAGLTQEELAAKIDKHIDTISNLERGKNCPHVDVLHDISRILKVPLVDLFADAERKQSKTRLAKEAEVRELIRGLSDKNLDLAADQLKAIAKTQKR